MQVLHHLLSKILLVTMIHTHREIEKPKKEKKYTISFPSLPTAAAKKSTPTFCHCRPPQFAFC